MDLEGFVRTLPWTSGPFRYDEKKMWFKTSSKPQYSKWRHANNDAEWKSSTESPLEQWNYTRLHEIQYLSQYHTTMKTPRSCKREALTRRCENEGFKGKTLERQSSPFFSILLFFINYNFRI